MNISKQSEVSFMNTCFLVIYLPFFKSGIKTTFKWQEICIFPKKKSKFC